MERTEKFLEMLPTFGTSSRREFLKRSVIMGTMIPVAGTLLAACGGGDGEEDGGDESGAASTPEATRDRSVPTASSGGGQPTQATDASPEATEEGGEASPEATEEEAEATEEPTGSGEPIQGGTMIWMGHHEIASLSPDAHGPTVHWVMIGQIHNNLVQLDPYFTLQPVLAESWEVSDDGMQYTFALNQGVLFHDGEEFNSEDVKYTYEYYGSPENAALTASNYNSIAFPVETPDDYTVVVNLSRVDASFLARAAQEFIVPQHHHSAVGEVGYKSDPIGTGPYRLTEYDPASFAPVEAFEDHFRGRPNIDVIRENVVPEPSVRTVALETGEADHSVWSLLTDDNIKLRDSGDFTVSVTSSLAVNHFPMNNERPFFQDKVVRQAMMYALDRDTIINDLWQGLAVKATSNLSPALEFYYEPDVKQYEYSAETAIQLLDEGGWMPGADGIREKDGVRLAWTCAVITGDQARKPIAELAQQWFGEIGMDMQIIETTSTSQGMQRGELDMALYNWTYGGGSGEPDGSNTLRSDALNNFSKYKNPRMDELLDQGVSTTDPDERKAIYSEIQKLVAEDVPFLFIKYWDWYTFYNKRIQGLPEDFLTTTHYMWANEWWLDDSQAT